MFDNREFRVLTLFVTFHLIVFESTTTPKAPVALFLFLFFFLLPFLLFVSPSPSLRSDLLGLPLLLEPLPVYNLCSADHPLSLQSPSSLTELKHTCRGKAERAHSPGHGFPHRCCRANLLAPRESGSPGPYSKDHRSWPHGRTSTVEQSASHFEEGIITYHQGSLFRLRP